MRSQTHRGAVAALLVLLILTLATPAVHGAAAVPAGGPLTRDLAHWLEQAPAGERVPVILTFHAPLGDLAVAAATRRAGLAAPRFEFPAINAVALGLLTGTAHDWGAAGADIQRPAQHRGKPELRPPGDQHRLPHLRHPDHARLEGQRQRQPAANQGPEPGQEDAEGDGQADGGPVPGCRPQLTDMMTGPPVVRRAPPVRVRYG